MKRKQPSKAAEGSSIASPEVQQIEHLLRFMSEHNLEELEYSRGDLRIRLKKPSTGLPMYARSMGVPEIIVPGMTERQASASQSGPPASPEPRATEDLHLVKSPIVGTYYEAPSPGAEAFVKIGAHVESGQTLCIVEAMKLMNEIESDESGELIRIFVENGQPVEYGQPLFGIRPSRKR
ncbi:MAG TPA: acetyl-CoA carboxylase biotin carboxyl carrier protein [Candidatus Cybelea sp.]|jgi:acetyl-CoA carboxylase biotin carboxyl carrier protein|nr:acetyl-CoA carboxylase biotin carboxyl carrier protein [Candidatus Cybelea sp.]